MVLGSSTEPEVSSEVTGGVVLSEYRRRTHMGLRATDVVVGKWSATAGVSLESVRRFDHA